jgi:hypothetical protein
MFVYVGWLYIAVFELIEEKLLHEGHFYNFDVQ